MAASTGPILAVGAITWANRTLLEEGGGGGWSLEETARIAVATGLGVAVLSAIEKASREIAVGLAYTALVTVLMVRMPDRHGRLVPTPLERAANFIR